MLQIELSRENIQRPNKYDNIVISGNLTSFHFYLLTPLQNQERGPSLKMKQLNQGTLIFSFYFICQEKRSIQQLSTDTKSHQVKQMANHNQTHECCVPSGWWTDEPDSLTGRFEFIQLNTLRQHWYLYHYSWSPTALSEMKCACVCVWVGGWRGHCAPGILTRTLWIRRNKPYDILAHSSLHCHTVHSRTFTSTIYHTVSVRWSYCMALIWDTFNIPYEIHGRLANKAN